LTRFATKLEYARRLAEADVPVETNHVPGAWHFFEAYAPASHLARQTTAHWLAAMRSALQPEVVRNAMLPPSV
jgi:acetyl esterase